VTRRRLSRAEREALRHAVDRERRRSVGLLTADEILREELANRPRPLLELAATARACGITLQGLRTAARRLQLVGRDGDTWSLPTSGENR
jgi:hypothetical protein